MSEVEKGPLTEASAKAAKKEKRELSSRIRNLMGRKVEAAPKVEKIVEEPNDSEIDWDSEWKSLGIDEVSVGRPPDVLTRRERLKAWMTCSRYLMAVSPVIAGLALIGALGVLANMGVYVHPIYEWIAPYWRPWMNTVWLTIGPILGAAALLMGYARCRASHSSGKAGEIAEEMEQNEQSILEEIDDL